MSVALLLGLLAGELDRADEVPEVPVQEVAAEPEPPPEPPLPEPGFAPDPVAIHPAGLDPLTLCNAIASCAPEPAPSLAASASVSGALLAYAHHPTRTGGSELAARIDLWRGLTWSAELGYTLDAIDTARGTTRYHDAMIGGRLVLPTARPAWLIATAHVASGDAVGGNGAAGFVAAGARVAGLDLQLGVAGMTLDGGGGVTGSLRAGLTGERVGGWLELDVQDTSAGARVFGAAGLTAHRGSLAFDAEALVGDRAYAVLDSGEAAEAIGDVFHTTGRVLVRYDLAHLHPYLGGSVRSGTTSGTDYTVLTAFAGLSLSF